MKNDITMKKYGGGFEIKPNEDINNIMIVWNLVCKDSIYWCGFGEHPKEKYGDKVKEAWELKWTPTGFGRIHMWSKNEAGIIENIFWEILIPEELLVEYPRIVIYKIQRIKIKTRLKYNVKLEYSVTMLTSIMYRTEEEKAEIKEKNAMMEKEINDIEKEIIKIKKKKIIE